MLNIQETKIEEQPKDVHIHSHLGVCLVRISYGSENIQNRDESSFIVEVKESQYSH